MKLRLPSLRTFVQGAHKNGAVSHRVRVTQEADRIRRAERGGHQAGLAEVLLILREKNQARR